jgi:hypothetical protein
MKTKTCNLESAIVESVEPTSNKMSIYHILSGMKEILK